LGEEWIIDRLSRSERDSKWQRKRKRKKMSRWSMKRMSKAIS
jgi:hypothetical protein